MKVDIVTQTIDVEKLLDKINEFEVITNQEAYLFMSRTTMRAIASKYTQLLIDDGKSMCPFLNGRSVYVKDKLQFGEVEIR